MAGAKQGPTKEPGIKHLDSMIEFMDPLNQRKIGAHFLRPNIDSKKVLQELEKVNKGDFGKNDVIHHAANHFYKAMGYDMGDYKDKKDVLAKLKGHVGRHYDAIQEAAESMDIDATVDAVKKAHKDYHTEQRNEVEFAELLENASLKDKEGMVKKISKDMKLKKANLTQMVQELPKVLQYYAGAQHQFKKGIGYTGPDYAKQMKDLHQTMQPKSKKK